MNQCHKYDNGQTIMLSGGLCCRSLGCRVAMRGGCGCKHWRSRLLLNLTKRSVIISVGPNKVTSLKLEENSLLTHLVSIPLWILVHWRDEKCHGEG